jgi:hypothetical protein
MAKHRGWRLEGWGGGGGGVLQKNDVNMIKQRFPQKVRKDERVARRIK